MGFYALSLLLKISDGFKADTFRKIGLKGSSKDWETLVMGFIEEWEENNSGIDMFHFDSDENRMYHYLDRGSLKLNEQN